jgi:hypothetical protein
MADYFNMNMKTTIISMTLILFGQHLQMMRLDDAIHLGLV